MCHIEQQQIHTQSLHTVIQHISVENWKTVMNNCYYTIVTVQLKIKSLKNDVIDTTMRWWTIQYFVSKLRQQYYNDRAREKWNEMLLDFQWRSSDHCKTQNMKEFMNWNFHSDMFNSVNNNHILEYTLVYTVHLNRLKNRHESLSSSNSGVYGCCCCCTNTKSTKSR